MGTQNESGVFSTKQQTAENMIWQAVRPSKGAPPIMLVRIQHKFILGSTEKAKSHNKNAGI